MSDTRFKLYEGRWGVYVDVTIRRNSDGATVVCCDEECGYPAKHDGDLSGPSFMWSEGNYSCDCNRHLYFERAQGRDPDVNEDQCSHGRYDIIGPQWLVDVIAGVEREREERRKQPPLTGPFRIYCVGIDQDGGAITLGRKP